MASKAEAARARLEALKTRRAEAAASNYEDTKEEDRRKSENPRDVRRDARKMAEARELEEQEQAEEAGLDYRRVKAMDKNIEQAQWEAKQKEKAKRREVVGFANFEDVALRKFKRLTDALKPDLAHYAEQKMELGDDFYRDVNSLTHGMYDKVDPQRVDALVEDLKKQEQARLKARKIRKVDPNADVDFINDRNRRFNEKVSKAFDPYTQDIKDNLERGTAL